MERFFWRNTFQDFDFLNNLIGWDFFLARGGLSLIYAAATAHCVRVFLNTIDTIGYCAYPMGRAQLTYNERRHVP